MAPHPAAATDSLIDSPPSEGGTEGATEGGPAPNPAVTTAVTSARLRTGRDLPPPDLPDMALAAEKGRVPSPP
eukprot:7305294-Pyramimonas_sp.AAC.1